MDVSYPNSILCYAHYSIKMDKFSFLISKKNEWKRSFYLNCPQNIHSFIQIKYFTSLLSIMISKNDCFEKEKKDLFFHCYDKGKTMTVSSSVVSEEFYPTYFQTHRTKTVRLNKIYLIIFFVLIE